MVRSVGAAFEAERAERTTQIPVRQVRKSGQFHRQYSEVLRIPIRERIRSV